MGLFRSSELSVDTAWGQARVSRPPNWVRSRRLRGGEGRQDNGGRPRRQGMTWTLMTQMEPMMHLDENCQAGRQAGEHRKG